MTSAGPKGGGASRSGVPPPLAESLNIEDRLTFDLTSVLSMNGVEHVTRALNRAGRGVEVMHRSTVGRRSIEVGEALLHHVNDRRYPGLRAAGVVIDGTVIKGHTIAWALAVSMDGTKVPLGVTERPTEEADVYLELLEGLRERELDTDDVLWVMDGGKAVLGAVRQFAGPDAVLQRCIVHKTRNVFKPHIDLDAKIAIGRRLVEEHLAQPDLEPVFRHDKPYLRLTRGMLEALSDARGGGEPLLADARTSDAEKKVLRQIGERMIRRELYGSWGRDDFVLARNGLLGVADWLESWGYEGAANSLRGDLDETLTLQYLRVADKLTRRLMRTTNMIESPHEFVQLLENRGKRYQHPTQRLRVATVAIAHAEQSFKPVAERARIEQLSLALVGRRHPDVRLELTPTADPDGLRLTRVFGYDPDQMGEALDRLVRWADRNGTVLEFPESLLGLLPTPGEWRSRLEGYGFSQAVNEPGTLVRPPEPGARFREVEGQTATPAAALARASAALDGDHRMVAGFTDTALRLTPSMAERTVAELEADAARLEGACRDLTWLRADVDHWWDRRGEEAAKEAAIEVAAAARDGKPEPDPLAGTRRWLLSREQADELGAQVVMRTTQLEWFDPRRLHELTERVGTPLAGLDQIGARVDVAARAVAAVYVLDARRRIEVADERVRTGDGPREVIPAAPPGREDTPSPVEQRRRPLGERSADALAAYSQAVRSLPGSRPGETLLREVDDATLLALRDELGGAWSSFEKPSGIETVRLEDGVRASLVKKHHAAIRDEVRSQRIADDSKQSKPTRKGRAERVAKAREAGVAAQAKLSQVDVAIDRLHKAPGARDRFVADHPEVALHDAVVVECERRSRERELVPEFAASPQPLQLDLPAVPAIDAGPAL